MSASLTGLVLLGVASPAALFVVLGVRSLVNRPLTERWTARLAASALTVAFTALLTALVASGATSGSERLLRYGAWSTAYGGGIAIEFLVDRFALAFAALSAAILGVVSAFSNRYLHREPGYNRYFVLLAMFATGMLLVTLAGNVEVLFVGWELVGLSSALLVAFFHERPASVSNAFRVLSVYRVSDAAMLSAAVLLRHLAGSDSLSLLFSDHAAATAGLTGTQATLIAILLLVAVAGKSALLPFSSWLPRAMEGPTPSSAVYYGALSIHAGCFLLLRAAPIFEQAPAARLLAGALGAATALYAAVTTRVQTDVKSSLAYASLTQVGIIVVEIALGWHTIAFVHLAGHASFRLLQFLSAPNVLHDLHGIEDALGNRPSPRIGRMEALVPHPVRRAVFLIALERGFLDSLLEKAVVGPFTRLSHRMERLDRWLCEALLPREQPAAVAGGDDQDE